MESLLPDDHGNQEIDTKDSARLCSFVSQAVKDATGWVILQENDNFFKAGMDSL